MQSEGQRVWMGRCLPPARRTPLVADLSGERNPVPPHAEAAYSAEAKLPRHLANKERVPPEGPGATAIRDSQREWVVLPFPCAPPVRDRSPDVFKGPRPVIEQFCPPGWLIPQRLGCCRQQIRARRLSSRQRDAEFEEIPVTRGERMSITRALEFDKRRCSVLDPDCRVDATDSWPLLPFDRQGAQKPAPMKGAQIPDNIVEDRLQIVPLIDPRTTPVMRAAGTPRRDKRQRINENMVNRNAPRSIGGRLRSRKRGVTLASAANFSPPAATGVSRRVEAPGAPCTLLVPPLR